MNRISATRAAGGRRPRWAWRTVTAAAAAVGFTLLGTGCASVFGHPSAPKSSAGAGSAGTGTGGSGHVSTGNRTGSQGQSTSGSFSLAFARCMRANGVPAFPNPNGQGGQLGPGSGIDPTSPQFQAAINGPCLSLAPPGWVSSGKVMAPGSSPS